MAHLNVRRDFIRHAAAIIIPLMHVGGMASMTSLASALSNDPPRGASRFARLRLRTAPMQDMERFYRTTLGMPVERRRDGSLHVIAGDTAIEFAESQAESQPYYHFAFNIPHNKLQRAMQWMSSRAELIRRSGIDEVVFHFPAWDAHAIYFLDPAGNIVEFIARHTLKNDAPGDFGPGDILCASEIGVVTPNVADASDQIKKATGLANYKVAGPEFTAVGDEHGLFIVVKAGRRWFSTDRPAEVFEAEAVLRDPSREVNDTLSASQFRISTHE